RVLLSTVRGMMKAADPNRPEDPYIVQRLALLTYKGKQPTPQEALEEARALLETLNPATSNDTETLGLWGAVHKRLWDETGDGARAEQKLQEAFAVASAPWMKDSTQEQMGKLGQLLADSPLKYVKADGE